MTTRMPNPPLLMKTEPHPPPTTRRQTDKTAKVKGRSRSDDINELVKSIISSPANLNNLTKLLTIKSPTSLSVISTIFQYIRHSDDYVGAKEWIDKMYTLYKTVLISEIGKRGVFALCMDQVKEHSINTSLNGDKLVFDNAYFIRICNAALQANIVDQLIELLDSYADLKYYFYKNIIKLDTKSYAAALDTLLKLAPPPSDIEAAKYFISTPELDPLIEASHLSQLKYHRTAFSNCWISILRTPLTEVMYRRVLVCLHEKILPFLTEPVLLIDFLTHSYDAGGVVGVLALNGLFTLIQEHNLDYPHFYKKLYAILDRDITHVKYRDRFFRLLSLFLKSTHLPAHLVAAFAKRLARLSLTSSPAAILSIIPLIYNILITHPSTLKLIHTTGDDPEAGGTTDVFDERQDDPEQSRAMESCLWEVSALKEHYHHNVSQMARVFEEGLTRRQYDLEDFVGRGYGSLIKEAELDEEQDVQSYDGGLLVLNAVPF